ncbi:fructose-6-phosphate 2-kinase [Naegleria gruberi]|uniref:Fructose-6-phosphate 2-kinase n=1 Tax=Naegleria gruberi TaxID=5762 RepID=D2V934_NAEGR|nr:fructose-6-phosphate 2-kinase [Naegleria gruberi]EFC46521.1 fructose-6-phosphate 2-kinase [Naegleria gruberi]|eukprot:XP_002679265.1 fructose-6-phosphate 2-kinase [Naegleria gruberi strain NEG-M]
MPTHQPSASFSNHESLEISNPQVLPSTPIAVDCEESNFFQDHKKNPSKHYVIVMVGLPARGKSYIARQLTKYLNWLNIDCSIFNAGEKRREMLGAGQSSFFWDKNNSEGQEQRKRIGLVTLQELIDWLMLDETENEESSKKMKYGGGNCAEEYTKREIKCAIFDATNTTRERRQMIIDHLTDKNLPRPLEPNHIIFVESICNNPQIIEANVRDIKIKSSDYKGVSAEQAINDFMQRIKAYEQVYETISDDEEKRLSYIQMIDIGKKFILNRIGGYVPGKINQCLMNIHLAPRVIWLSRHGESMDNTMGLLGGDSNLTEKGQCYAKVLYRFVKRMQEERRNQEISIEKPQLDNMMVWTSLLKRTQQTSFHFKHDENFKVVRWRCLNELDAGVCEGMTYERVKEELPHEYEAREADKFRYRPQNGESYLDMIYRIEPAIAELERQRCPLLIIGHQAVNRILYSYLTGLRPETCTRLPIPLNTVIEIIPNAYGVEEKRYDLNQEVQKEYELIMSQKK